MFTKPKLLASSLIAVYALAGSAYAADYTNTSFYAAYDSADTTQFALVMPSVQKVYTHKAGEIQTSDLTQVDGEFSSFPTYNNGELCFPALKAGATGIGGASKMAGQCYNVKFFYTQKETIAAGTAFMLYYTVKDRIQEGLAGQPTTFQTVKEGDVITNENSITGDDYTNFSFDLATATISNTAALPQEKLPAQITSDMTLTKNKIWYFEGKVVVTNGATLTIEPGTTIAGREGDGDATSYMIIDKGSKIMAEGTDAEHIVFTSTKVALDGEAAAVGQWGGITIIGKAANPQVKPYEADTDFVADSTDMADNSGVLKYVEVLNSGITKAPDEEFNGLSMVGVGSGTTVDHIIVNKSDDDCMEIWGGTVNVSNIDVSECTDDHFDIDDGYAGTVTNLKIVGTIGHSGIEMSGDTAATFNGFDITMNDSDNTEGAIYFKGDGIGGDFKNGTVTNNVSNGFGAIHSTDGSTVDIANTSFEGVTLAGTSTDKFTGGSAAALENAFDAGTGNNK